MRIAIALVFCIALSQGALGQIVTGRFTTSVYGWERQDNDSSQETTHLRAYENVQLDVGGGMISFHTYLQGSTDLNEQMENDPTLRLFNAYLDVKNVGDMLDLRIGRQAVFAGVNYGTVDGALLRVRPADGIEVMGYGGGLTPPSQRTDFFQDLDNNWQVGAQALLYLIEDMKIGLSYMNRHRATRPFQTFRSDDQLGLITTTIDYGSRANQYGSLNLTYAKEWWWAMGRVDYDFNFERVSRAELAATMQATPRLGFSLNLTHREPTIAYNSYFTIFEMNANQEALIGVDYVLFRQLSLLGRFSYVQYDDDNAMRFSVGAGTKYASIMYTKDVSYDGDLDGFNMQVAYPFFQGKFIPHAGAVYSNYALAENEEKTSTFAGVLGATYRPMQTLSFDVQGQYLTNKLYKSDMRGLARVSWWFSEPFGSSNQTGQ